MDLETNHREKIQKLEIKSKNDESKLNNLKETIKFNV